MKSKFKKTIVSLSGLAGSLILLVGCTTGEGAGYQEWDPLRSPSDIEATIEWWNNYVQVNDTPTNRASRSYAEYFWAKDAIDAFNELYPNITVEMRYIGNYAAIQTQVNAGLSGGNVPNIASCYGDHVAGYKNVDATLSMDGFMDDPYIGLGKGVDEEGNIIDDSSTLKSDFNSVYFEGEKSMYESNEYLSLPFSKSAETLVVNLDVFNAEGEGPVSDSESESYEVPVATSTKEKYEIPTNWRELISLARQMKEDFPDVFSTQKDSDGYYTAVPFVYESAENMFISFLEMSDLPYTDGSGDTLSSQILFNTEEAQEIVYQLKEWNDEGLICTQDQLELSDESTGYHKYSTDLINSGKCFMCITSTTDTRYFVSDDYDAGFYATPTFTMDCLDGETGEIDESKHAVISQGPSLTFFDKADIDENYASWLFYKFITNTENNADFSASTSYFPLRESVYETDEIKEVVEAAETASEEGSYDNVDKTTAYTGEVFELNETYTENNDYIFTDVFDESSQTRTAVGDLLVAVFDYTPQEELGTEAYETEVKEKISNEFTAAFSSAVGAN